MKSISDLSLLPRGHTAKNPNPPVQGLSSDQPLSWHHLSRLHNKTLLWVLNHQGFMRLCARDAGTKTRQTLYYTTTLENLPHMCQRDANVAQESWHAWPRDTSTEGQTLLSGPIPWMGILSPSPHSTRDLRQGQQPTPGTTMFHGHLLNRES